MNKLITIVGPTAVGKTDLTLALAKYFQSEVISGDAYQVYKQLNIGTAKPSREELQAVPHHLIDIIEAEGSYSVADFKLASEKLISKLNQEGKIPILSGGTGLYVQALLENYHLSDTEQNSEVRSLLDNIYKEKGIDGLREYGEKLAQENNIELKFTDKHRLYRAIELLLAHDIEALTKQNKEGLSYDGPVIGLVRPREDLYERINLRVDIMVNNGLFEEVEALLKAGLPPESQSLTGIGYKEVVSYLAGEYSKERCIELIKQNTRHFAKRQITWYKRMPYINWISIDKQKTADEVFKEAKKIITTYFKKD